jgi:hypothetical protein
METAGFCMIDWVMGNQTSGYQWSKGYLEAEADFLREIIVSFHKFHFSWFQRWG